MLLLTKWTFHRLARTPRMCSIYEHGLNRSLPSVRDGGGRVCFTGSVGVSPATDLKHHPGRSSWRESRSGACLRSSDARLSLSGASPSLSGTSPSLSSASLSLSGASLSLSGASPSRSGVSPSRSDVHPSRCDVHPSYSGNTPSLSGLCDILPVLMQRTIL